MARNFNEHRKNALESCTYLFALTSFSYVYSAVFKRCKDDSNF